MRPSYPVDGKPTATDHGQTALQPDRSQKVRLATADQGMPETPAVTLEPVASSVADTGGVRLTPYGKQGRRSKTDGWTSPTLGAGARSRRPRMLLLLLMLVMLGSIAIWTPEGLQAMAATTIELLRPPDIPESRAAAGPGPLVGQLEVTSAPSGAELYVDDGLRGVTPLQLVLNVGNHQLTFVSPLGNVRRRVRVRPGHRTLFSEAIFPGSLVVSSSAGLEVHIDGSSIGTSGDRAMLVAPGSHQVDLVNAKSGARTTHTIEVLPGQTTTLDVCPPAGP